MEVIKLGIDREKTIRLFEEKAEELGKVPTAVDIQKDYRLPSYEEFRDEFGKIREAPALNEIVKKYTLYAKANKTFCEDCVYDKDDCGQNLKECQDEAELYYSQYDNL